MRKNLYLPSCILLLVLGSCHKQDPSLISPQPINKVYGGSADDGASKVILTADGGYLFSGWTGSNDGDVSGNHGRDDAWITKLDRTGKIQWQKTFGGSDGDGAQSVIKTTDGYIFAGVTYSNDGDAIGHHGRGDAWVVKIDLAGNKVWHKVFGGSGHDEAGTIVQAADGGYVILGYTDGNGVLGRSGALVIKIDKDGNNIWQKTLGGSGIDITLTKDAGYLVAGSIYSTDGNETIPNKGRGDAWIAKLDGNGNKQWQKTFGGSGDDIFRSVGNTTDNGYVVTGITTSNDGDVIGKHPGTTTALQNSSDAWVIKFSESGNIIWQRTLGDEGVEYQGHSIMQSEEGDYIIAASIYQRNQVKELKNDALVAKLDGAGNIVWQKIIGGSMGESFFSVTAIPAWGYALAGGTNSNDGDISGNHGRQDAWIYTMRSH